MFWPALVAAVVGFSLVGCVILEALNARRLDYLADKMPSAPWPADETPVFHAGAFTRE